MCTKAREGRVPYLLWYSSSERAITITEEIYEVRKMCPKKGRI